MALTQAQRTGMREKLTPAIGEEYAETLMAELDQIVTKEFVREEIAGVRLEVAELRGDVNTGFARLEAAMATGFGQLRAEWKDDLKDVVEGTIKWTITTTLTVLAIAATILGLVALFKG